MSKILRAAYENSYWYELIDDKFKAACFAEFIAMVYFIVLAVGGAMTTLHTVNPNLLEIALSFGFSIMVIAQFCGPLSGAHINCAVTFALFIGGRISGIRCLYYTGNQLFGAFVGAVFLLIIFGPNFNTNFASNQWDPDVFHGGNVFLAEMFGTAILIFNVYATIDHPIAGGGALGIFPISMSVLVAHLYLVPIDGCSINPTRSFGPYLIACYCGKTGLFREQQYMFWFGPYLGASIASLLYEYGSLKPKRRSGGGDLSKNLHLSEVAGTAHVHDNDVVDIPESEDGDDDDDEDDDDDDDAAAKPFVWTVANVVETLQIFNFLGIPSPFTNNNSTQATNTTTSSSIVPGTVAIAAVGNKNDIELNNQDASASTRPWGAVPTITTTTSDNNNSSSSGLLVESVYRVIEYIYGIDGEDEDVDVDLTTATTATRSPVVVSSTSKQQTTVSGDLISFAAVPTEEEEEEQFVPSVSTTTNTTVQHHQHPTESKETQTIVKQVIVMKDAMNQSSIVVSTTTSTSSSGDDMVFVEIPAVAAEHNSSIAMSVSPSTIESSTTPTTTATTQKKEEVEVSTVVLPTTATTTAVGTVYNFISSVIGLNEKPTSTAITTIAATTDDDVVTNIAATTDDVVVTTTGATTEDEDMMSETIPISIPTTHSTSASTILNTIDPPSTPIQSSSVKNKKNKMNKQQEEESTNIPISSAPEPTTLVPDLIQYYEDKSVDKSVLSRSSSMKVNPNTTNTSTVVVGSMDKITPNKPNKPNKNKSMKSP